MICSNFPQYLKNTFPILSYWLVLLLIVKNFLLTHSVSNCKLLPGWLLLSLNRIWRRRWRVRKIWANFVIKFLKSVLFYSILDCSCPSRFWLFSWNIRKMPTFLRLPNRFFRVSKVGFTVGISFFASQFFPHSIVSRVRMSPKKKLTHKSHHLTKIKLWNDAYQFYNHDYLP